MITYAIIQLRPLSTGIIMKEQHFAYKIARGTEGFLYPYFELQQEKMLDLLKEIDQHSEGLFWVFKQIDDKPQEELCIVDCANNRIYYHYSGNVENLDTTISRLTHHPA
jgi:hypothetical protein